MKRDTTDGPLFFIAKSIRLSISNDTEEETQSHEVYFFEEHSCPTNWLRDIVAVIEDGDCDPHGIFDVIRSIHIPDDFSTDDDSQWPLLFPEALGGTIIDAAVSPEMKLLAGEGEPPTEKSQSTPDGANGR